MNILKDFNLFLKNHKSFIQNLVLLSITLFSIVLFVHQSVQINKQEIWFSNMDMDSSVLVESLLVNSGKEPQFMFDPALSTFIVYGKFLKLFDTLNIIPVSEFNQLEASDDPLMLLPDIYYKGRTISIIIAIFSAIIFGLIFYLLTKRLLIFTISTISFLFTSGLVFQSLLLRSELTSVFFALISLFLLIIYSKSKKPSFLTIITSGVLFGFAMLSKIQVLPVLIYMVVLLLYIAFKKQKKYPEGFLKQKKIHFLFVTLILAIHVYFVNLIYHYYSDHASWPVLLFIFVLIIILSATVSLLLSPNKRKLSSFLNHMNLYLMGFLMSFLIVFYLTNISTDNMMRDILDLAFQSATQGPVMHELLHSTSGISMVFEGFVRFLKYYLLESYLMIFIFLFFLLTIKRIDRKATLTFIFGIGYCLFSSLRHFGPHYLIYSDIFFTATLILLVIRFLLPKLEDNEYKSPLVKSSIKYTLIILILFLLGQSQLNFVKKNYPEYGERSRNKIDEIPFSHDKNNDYSEMMIRKYKNAVNIIERVYNDPYLNGSEDGIDITEKVNYGIYGWLALPQVRDINFQVSNQDIINREMMNLLKSIYRDNKEKFDEIKERILNKALKWSAEEIERRIIREIPSNVVNFKMNDEVEFVGYDLVSNLRLGEKFELIFYWKCLKAINHRYSVLSSIDRGDDSIELGHRFEYHTYKWKPGEVIKEIHQFRVPDDIEPGEYEVRIGLYDINEKKEISPFIRIGKVNIFTPLKK